MTITCKPYLERSRTTLVIRFADDAGNPLEVLGYAPGEFVPTLTVGSVVTVLSRCYWSSDPAAPLPYATFLLDEPISPDAFPRYDASAGLFTTSAGPSPAAVGLAVDNSIAAVPELPAPEQRPMAVGWNLLPPDQAMPLFGNLWRNCTGGQYMGSDPANRLTDKLFPISSHHDQWLFKFGMSITNPLTGKPFPLYPAEGTSIQTWDGGCGGYLHFTPLAGTVLQAGPIDSGHPTGNRQEFSATVDGTGASPAPCFYISPTLGMDITDPSDRGRVTTLAGGPLLALPNGAGWNHHAGSSITPGAAVLYTIGYLPAGQWRVSHAVTPDPNATLATVTICEDGFVLYTYQYWQTEAHHAAAATDLNGTVHQFGPAGVTVATGGGLITVTLEGTAGQSGYLVADAIWFDLEGETVDSVPFQPWTALGLFPPGTDPDNPDPWHPSFLEAIGPAASLRDMQMDGAMTALSEPEDYPPADQLCFGGTGRTGRYAIESIGEWGDPNGVWEENKHSAKLTMTPLDNSRVPLRCGQPVTLPPGLVVPYADGSGSVDFSYASDAVEFDPTGMEPNQFAMAGGKPPNATGPLAEVLPVPPATDLGTAYTYFKAIPIDWKFQLDALRPGRISYCNVSLTCSKANATAHAKAYMRWMPRGSVLAVEAGNETWNHAYGYPGYKYCFMIGCLNGIPAQAGYAMLAAQIHDWFAEALEAEGRGDELRRVVNCQTTYPQLGQEVLDWCGANGKRIDWVMLTCYIAANPVQPPGLEALAATVTRAQSVDLARAWMLHAGRLIPYWAWYRRMAEDLAAVQGSPCGIGFYEGGLAGLTVGGDQKTQEWQALAGQYDPLVYPLMLDLFKACQDAGGTVLNLYNLTQPPVHEGTPYATAAYGKCLSYAPVAGIGDGSDGLPDNRPLLDAGVFDLDEMVVPTLAAVRDWNTAKTAPPEPPASDYTVAASTAGGVDTVTVTGPGGKAGTVITINLGTSADPLSPRGRGVGVRG